ncbi:23S rRNA (adenine(2503)-C(2))-methyltransferase RlmN [Buchnera aphidicola]|uniref:23S rRNA (adenine(2503)-C(2))-methyltransferase RlmN n=1 Tax=Buchnera aphidicola TaxID=9 RepID=UPI0031B8B2DD
MKINLLNFDRKKMRNFFISINEKYFHADQIFKWIYHYNYNNFDKMSNLSKKLRKKLKKIACIKSPIIINKKKSIDNSVKYIMKIDNKFIETVYIPEKNRNTICISSQIGCSLKCSFCSTGDIGFYRNLYVSEIIGQILNINKKLKKKKITNIVIMGMGEPLLNLKNIITSINIMKDNYGFNISKYRIRLSTVGITPGLKKLRKSIDVPLALSLHAPNNKLRSKIIPVNKKYNINEILNEIKKYLKISKTNKKKITIEYIMLKNINDSIKIANQLIKILNNIPSKINLIPFNYYNKSNYFSSNNKKILKFYNFLKKKNFIVTIRKNRGNDINAACGQLSLQDI